MPDGVLPEPGGLPVDPDLRQRQLKLAGELGGVVGRLKLVMYFFEQILRDARIQMYNPPATHVTLLLSRRPRPGLDFGRAGKDNVIQLDRAYDPRQLLDLPVEARALGEFALDCWEWALPRLEGETDFPGDFLREKIEQFRVQGYALSNTLKPVGIAGSKAKARIHGTVSCARTVLRLEVAYQGKVLFEREIWDTPEQAFNIAYSKREVAVVDGALKVNGARQVHDHFLLPEAVFPLETLPADFLKTLI